MSAQGHDSVRLMALLALPLFALNGRSLYGLRPPHLVWRIAAVGAFSFFLWISLSLWHRTVGPPGLGWARRQRTSLFMIATNDIIPIRTGSDEPMPMVLAWVTLLLTIWLIFSSAWLLIRHEQENVRKRVTKVRQKVVRAARRSVVGFSNAMNAPGSRASCAWRNSTAMASTWAGRGRPGSLPGRPRGLIAALELDSAGFGTGGGRGGGLGGGGPRDWRGGRGGGRPSCLDLLRRVAWLVLVALVAAARKLGGGAMTICLGRSVTPRRLSEAPWIEATPGWWSESEAMRRGRAARNHVRTMLMGRAQYHIYKKREHKSFFYPQRLWMALGLSLWIQLLITLFFVNTVRWFSTALAAAEAFDEKVVVESQHHAAIDEATRFAPIFRTVMLLVWALLADEGRGKIVHGVLTGVGTAVPILQSLVLLANWVHVFVLFRERIMKMRQGEYFFDRKLYREEYASLYIGYQVAGMTLSGFFFMAAGLVRAALNQRATSRPRRTPFLGAGFVACASLAHAVCQAAPALAMLAAYLASPLPPPFSSLPPLRPPFSHSAAKCRVAGRPSLCRSRCSSPS